MSEVVKFTDYGDGEDDDDDGDERVLEWERGLPNLDDLTPLSQALIPPELASAFSISPEPFRTLSDVNRASRHTLSNIRGEDRMVIIEEPSPEKIRRLEEEEEQQEEEEEEAENCCAAAADQSPPRASKRQRLVWTPQLHKRFVEVVSHLGIKKAVPKTIMQLMNVDGLTRENVASHLQKYRLYLKRMSNGGGSNTEGSSDQESSGGGGDGNGHVVVQFPMRYPPLPPPMMPVANFHSFQSQYKYGMGHQRE